MANNYEVRILRVLKYIHDHPDQDLSLDALADVAAMSRFHWHRVFHGMTGETCAQAVRRIRLYRAACWLVQQDWLIAVIAAKVGYPNVQSFSRAFKARFSTSPGVFRTEGVPVAHTSRARKGFVDMYTVEITETPRRALAASPHTGPYDEIGKTFERLYALAAARSLWPSVRGVIPVYLDDPSAVAAAELRSFAALVLAKGTPLPEELEDVAIDAGRSAVLHYKGPYDGLAAAYQYLYGEWLPGSGEEPRDAPVYEDYLNNPADTAPEDLLTDVVLPLN